MTINSNWYKNSDNKLHEKLFSLVKRIEKDNKPRKNRQLIYSRLYNNNNNYNDSNNPDYRLSNSPERIKLNVIASCIDTASAKISKTAPKIILQTSAADFSISHKAKQLEKFIAGCFYESEIRKQATKIFIDCCIYGTGILKIFEQNGNIVAERVIPFEIIVDAEEALYGQPRSIYQKKHISRDVALQMFPDKASAIKDAELIADDDFKTAKLKKGIDIDYITVIECWHLKSSCDAKDGKHVISTSKGVLVEEDYNYGDFPFVFLNWKNPLFGFWGTGIIDDILGIQIEINTLLNKIQKSFHLISTPTVFVDQASAISKAYLNNNIGNIVPYTGKPPIVATPSSVNQEIFAHLENLYAKAYQITGISALSATSQKPSGINSGTALREYNDIQSERFAVIIIEFEQMFIKAAKKMVCLASDMYDNKNDLEVTVKGKKFIEKIKWSDIDLSEDQYVLTVGAASALPDTRSGRLQTATEWLQMGAISVNEWRELIYMPDIDESQELLRAPKDYIKRVVEKILLEGVVIEPEAIDDLSFALSYGTMIYNKSKLENVDDDKLELLREWIDSVLYLIQMAEEEQIAKQMQMQQAQQQMDMARQTQPGPPPAEAGPSGQVQ